MISRHLSVFLLHCLIAVVISVKPSNVTIWSKQREIEDFVLHEQTNEVYVAATFLYHVADDLYFKPKSMFESNELTATNVIISTEINTGFACTTINGFCFLFNISNVSQINSFDQTVFLPTSKSPTPIPDMDILPITLRGNQSISFIVANEKTAVLAYNILLYPFPSFTNESLDLSFTNQFTGDADKSVNRRRRTLLSYSLRGFVYFVVRHVEGADFDNPTNSFVYIMRMCENEDSGDIPIVSLVEIRLEPCDGSKEYPQKVAFGHLDNFYGEVLLITYTTNGNAIDSNLCVYTQYDIDTAFNTTIQSCFDGSASVQYIFPWLETASGGSRNCAGGRTPLEFCKLCSQIDSTICRLYNYTGVPGTEISGYSLPLYNKITALYPISIDEVDLIFVGNAIGDLIKYELTSNNAISQIEDVELGNLLEAPFNKMLASANSEYLYASRSTLLYKIDIINCEAYTSCEDCVNTVDPICGYCSLTETCTRKSACASPDLSLRWITYDSSNCLSLDSITPAQAQIGEIIEVAISVNNLPQLLSPDTYQCDFIKNRTDVSRITVSGVNVNLTGPETAVYSTLYCYVPSGYSIPNDYQQINFSLISTELNSNFASQQDSFTFYDCSYHSKCESCASSPADCYWCLYNSICTHNSAQCQMAFLSPSNDSSSCPAVTSTSGLSVHIGNSTDIDVLELVTANAPEPMGAFNYSCVYAFDSSEVTREGIWQSSVQVDCVPPPKLYSINGTETVQLELIWGMSGMYYNITVEPIRDVTIFNCAIFEQTCSVCFGLGGGFGCGNCYKNVNKTGDPTCRLETQCSDQTFINSGQGCPNPTIFNFEPKGGHILGGTPMVITGENLGGSRDDLEVLVANISCEITDYDIGKKISCNTGAFNGLNLTGLVTVSVKGQTINSTESYRYLLPTMISVYTYFPNNSLSSEIVGVKEGGTKLFIQGANLGIGLVREIFIKDNIRCVIQMEGTPVLDSENITCNTEASSEETAGVITLNIDREELDYQLDLFRYEKLEITDTDSSVFIPAGGISIKIKLNSVRPLHSTKLTIVNSNNAIISEELCTDISDDSVYCPSPSFTYSRDLVAQLVVDNLNLTITGIDFVKNNPTCEQNPVYTDSIIIKGSNFESVLEEHYNITISAPASDQVNCVIIIYSNNSLECRPEQKISGILFVQIGSNLTCTFNSPVSPESNVNPYIISGSSTLLLMFLLSVFLITCFVIVISHYKYKKVREIESLIHQYSKLESNIARECKTGFAELQVEIVDFVQAAETNTIPFTDYQTYVVKLLFPNSRPVEFLSLPPTDPLKANEEIDTFRRAMKSFQELFNNKDFLVELIRVFDQSQNFDANEKSYFASLLMIALHKNLFYATEILKVLIDDLITKSLNKPHQEMKTLFRSTSVCEKLLSHWLALCLYNYLKGRPGEELYNLYSAIKVQINKGPIDAITGEAKYSLNQDNMLRMAFDVNEFEILCYFGDNFENTKLLDCDTISQVKRKIIDTLNKNMLASEKPDPDQLELIYVKPKDFSPKPNPRNREITEDPFGATVINNPIYSPGDNTMAREIPNLSMAKQTHLLFRDIDKTSGLDVGWRRINTMEHYFTLYNILSPQNGSLLLVLQSELQEKMPSLYSDILKRKSTESPPKIFHFSIPGSQKESTLERQKMVSEVYFTKLLSTKAILQKYIDEMMNSIFPDRIALQECPIAIKHLFDFLDERARWYNITDPEVIQTWKNNSVVLRFWVNLLKNPQFILDIDMPYPVDSTLSTIAQGLIDSCSTRDEELTRDSPVNKLLFAKDTKIYKKRVKKFYEDIQNLHQTQSSFNQHLRQMQLTNSPFFVESAVQEIFLVWVSGASFVGNLMTRLREQKLETQVSKFTQVLNMMSDNPTYDDTTII